jgi:hypothetical protein
MTRTTKLLLLTNTCTLLLAVAGFSALLMVRDAARPVAAPAERPPVLAESSPAPDSAEEHRPASFTFQFLGSWPEEAKGPVCAAAKVWVDTLQIKIPIRVDAYWAKPSSGDLAEAVPRPVSDFPNAPSKNTYYPAALAAHLTGQDVVKHLRAHADVTFDKDRKWYCGLDGEPPQDHYDLMTVALHELAHALGLFGEAAVDGTGQGRWCSRDDYTWVFDRYVVDHQDQPLLAHRSPSLGLGRAFVGGHLFFTCRAGGGAVSPNRASLHTRSEWIAGTCLYHLDEKEGAADSACPLTNLLSPRIEACNVIHAPGPVVLAMLRTIGWGRPSGDKP